MSKVGERIVVKKSKTGIRVEIIPQISVKDSRMLNVWLSAWSIMGIVVLTTLFFQWNIYERSQKVFMLIYLVFWSYLEFKVLYAYRWNKIGKEIIEIKNGKFSYLKLMGKRGLPFECNVSDLSYFHYEESTEKGIWNDMNRAAWMVAGEVIQYKFGKRVRRLGMKLNRTDAEKLSSILNKQSRAI